MEVRRLLTALHLLNEDANDIKIPQKVAELAAAVQAVIASPADPPTSETFFNAVEVLRVGLPTAKCNNAAGSIRLAIKDAGLSGLIGANLVAEIDGIVNATPFLMPRAAQAILALDKRVKNDIKVLYAGINALQSLNIAPEDIPTTEYEIGVLMPSAITKDDLRVVENELGEWVFVIGVIQELVDGQPSPTIPIRSISTGSLDLFCSFHATGAHAMVLLTMGVYSIFRLVRRAQEHRNEMEVSKMYPEILLNQMREHDKVLIETSRAEIVKDLLKLKSPNLAANRDGEMETLLKRAVDFMLRRVNQGVDIEVSTPPEAAAEREAATEEVLKMQREIERMRIDISTIARNLPDRSTPVLQLTEQPPDAEEPDPQISAKDRTDDSPEHKGRKGRKPEK